MAAKWPESAAFKAGGFKTAISGPKPAIVRTNQS